jgi:hypothetical protein
MEKNASEEQPAEVAGADLGGQVRSFLKIICHLDQAGLVRQRAVALLSRRAYGIPGWQPAWGAAA